MHIPYSIKYNTNNPFKSVNIDDVKIVQKKKKMFALIEHKYKTKKNNLYRKKVEALLIKKKTKRKYINKHTGERRKT